MRKRTFISITIILTAILLTNTTQAWEIKLNVDEMWNKEGKRYITCGVPLLPGQAMKTDQLSLATKNNDGDLTAVPSQFRSLARWWQNDNSIRWVLVDCTVVIEQGTEKAFYLTDAKLTPPVSMPKLTVEETDDRIIITTGKARFEVNRKEFNLLDKVFMDSNNDGQFTEKENLIEGSKDTGLVIEDTYGEKYYGSEGTHTVDVLEKGPMRICIRAKGINKARSGKGYSEGMYGYDCFLNFYADSTDVYVDMILANNPSKSIGSPTFEDASLFIKLASGKTRFELQGEYILEGRLANTEDSREKTNTYNIRGKQSIAGQLKAGESICLYQDSNGADTWNTCQGYDDKGTKQGWSFPAGTTSSFRGYRISKRTDKGEQIIANGDHARGLLKARSTRGGVIVHSKNFWQQFPKAVEIFANGTLRLGLFPKEYKVPHFLEDASAKGQEIILHFYAPGVTSQYSIDNSSTPAANLVADSWNSRAYLRPTLEHIAATGALADLGPFTVPTTGLHSKPDTRNGIDDRRMLTSDVFYGNAYGWQVFGERWRSQGGAGNHGARQPISEDNYLRRWYWTGVRDWFMVGDARSRHFRDVRAYRIEDQNPWSYPDWLTFRASNMSERRGDRPQPSNEEYKKYTKGLWRSEDCNEETPPPGNRLAFWMPNPEHNVIDLLYDRYLLFGDVRCLENMEIVVASGAYHTLYHKPVVFRAPGWCWRSLDRYWELTGNKNAEKMLLQIAEAYQPLVGQTPLVCRTSSKKRAGINWWFTGIFCRGVAMAALHTRDPNTLKLAETLAVGKEKRATRLHTLFSVLYHLTGDEKYKDAVLKDGKGKSRLSSNGSYLYPCSHWLLNQPADPLNN